MGSDTTRVYIYSDALNKMIKCEKFTLKPAGIIDFNDIQIPCNNYVVVTFMKENDAFPNVAYSLRIPCFMESQEGGDFVIKGGAIKNMGDMASFVLSMVGKIPGMSASGEFQAVQLLSDIAFSAGAAFLDDRDALYTLKGYVRMTPASTTSFASWTYSNCNAKVFNT